MPVEFGKLRELLHLPSEENWALICKIFDSVEPDELEAMVIPYCQHHLKSWDPKLRQTPKAWIEALFAMEPCPQLLLLEELFVRGSESEIFTIKNLAQNPYVSHIKHLRLEEVPFHGAAGMKHFLKSKHFSNLEALELVNLELNANAMKNMGASDFPSRLKILNLNYNHIKDEGFERLFNGVWWPLLEELELCGCWLGSESLNTLVRCDFPNLKRLNLGRHGFTDDDVRVLCRSRFFRQLTSLDLSDHELGAESLQSIIGTSDASMLKHLNLSRNDNRYYRRGTGVFEQVDSLHVHEMVQLESFAMAGSDIYWPDFEILVDSGLLRSVKKLDLSLNRIYQDDRSTSCFSEIVPNAEEINLSHVWMPERGLSWLLDSPPNSPLDSQWRVLHLAHCGLHNIDELINCEHMNTVEELTLDSNPLGDAWLDQLVTAKNAWPNLKKLSIRATGLTGVGVRRLADWPGISRLNMLVWHEQEIWGDEMRPLQEIETLNLVRQRW